MLSEDIKKMSLKIYDTEVQFNRPKYEFKFTNDDVSLTAIMIIGDYPMEWEALEAKWNNVFKAQVKGKFDNLYFDIAGKEGKADFMNKLQQSFLIDKEKSGPLFFYADAWILNIDNYDDAAVSDALKNNGFVPEE